MRPPPDLFRPRDHQPLERMDFKQHLHWTDGRQRVLIERPSPIVGDGTFPVKRVIGDLLTVTVDLIADGHDSVRGVVQYRPAGTDEWHEAPLAPLGNDRWSAAFPLDALGRWDFRVMAWTDAFLTWHHKFEIKAAVNQDIDGELLVGATLVREAAARARQNNAVTHDADATALADIATLLADETIDHQSRISTALGDDLLAVMTKYPDRAFATVSPRMLAVMVDPPLAQFSTWYEFFPRSTGDDGAHGTLATAAQQLPRIARMGFDVVYLPPIHPIGTTNRKGKNNALVADSGDVGSPWAIGGAAGGHTAIHPELGNLADFRAFVETANKLGLAVALDVAFQCSPDHPWVTAHPEWFVQRPNGTIQFAENPPKKYQDVYPINFANSDWRGLWAELKAVFEFWIAQGVTVFRVDNPHTKPLPFWEWCIGELKAAHPETIFLSEAFTRPKLMYALAKAGFTQSYTYFTWRNSKAEFEAYLTELTQTEVAQFFRPNFWPNTPDILPEHLQYGGRAAFVARYILAAMLSSNIGIYGPAFELLEHTARPGAEEYIDNEKYQLRDWPLDRPGNLTDLIARINAIRRANPALHGNASLRFHPTDNEQLICFSKQTADAKNIIITVVNLDFYHTQSGFIELDLAAFGMADATSYQLHDLVTDARYFWAGTRNYVELNPQQMPAHVFRVRRFVRREQDFEYYA